VHAPIDVPTGAGSLLQPLVQAASVQLLITTDPEEETEIVR
jgi:hypothetical protein